MDIINVIVNFWYVNIEVHIENVQKSFKVTHISITVFYFVVKIYMGDNKFFEFF